MEETRERRICARGLYARQEMARLIAPKSVAVVGVSERANAFGSRAVANMKTFDGRLYQINAKHAELGGSPCYPSIAALPETPDCVVIATPREAVEPVARECAARGVGAILVFAAGFAETGKPEHVAMQQRLVAIARDADMRLVGPNTIGIVNYRLGGRAHILRHAGPAALAAAQHRHRQPIGLARLFAGAGGGARRFGEPRPDRRELLRRRCRRSRRLSRRRPELPRHRLPVRGHGGPSRMLAAAELAWKADKPLIVYKIATGQEGARAAMSHTGSLAGSEAAYAAGFARAGVVQVDKLEALVEAAAFFAKAGAPKAAGAVVIATSGGATIIAADKAELHGVALPQPGPQAAEVLAREVPEYGSTRNPCDVTAQVISSGAALAACADALLADPLYGVMVTSHAYAYESATSRLPVFSRAAAANGKIVCNVWAPEWLGGPGAFETESDPHLALFHSMDRCFVAIAAWNRRSALRGRETRRERISNPRREGRHAGAARGDARRVADRARSQAGDGALWRPRRRRRAGSIGVRRWRGRHKIWLSRGAQGREPRCSPQDRGGTGQARPQQRRRGRAGLRGDRSGRRRHFAETRFSRRRGSTDGPQGRRGDGRRAARSAVRPAGCGRARRRACRVAARYGAVAGASRALGGGCCAG